MTPNAGTLNEVLRAFLEHFDAGLALIRADALSLLSILILLEIITISLWWAYSGDEALGKLIRKCLSIGFFIWIISEYDWIISVIVGGFVATGQRVAPSALPLMENPSGVLAHGAELVYPIFNAARRQVGFSVAGIFDAAVMFVGALVIYCCYAILAIQIFLTRIEFGLVSTLGLILVPFGVFKHTAFLAEKVFGAVISFGVKLMVLAFVVSLGFPLISGYILPPDPGWSHMLSVATISCALCVLALHAPAVASGLLAGSPSLSLNHPVANARNAWQVGTSGTHAAKVAAHSGVRAVGAGLAVASGAGGAIWGVGKGLGGRVAQGLAEQGESSKLGKSATALKSAGLGSGRATWSLTKKAFGPATREAKHLGRVSTRVRDKTADLFAKPQPRDPKSDTGSSPKGPSEDKKESEGG